MTTLQIIGTIIGTIIATLVGLVMFLNWIDLSEYDSNDNE